MRHAALFVALCLLLAACAGTSEPDDRMVPPGSDRQAELTRLYDRLGSDNEGVGNSAAETAAAGDERDHRFLASLWGTRKKSIVGARRLGAALSKAGRHQPALDWFQRAFMEVAAGDELAHWLRYEMANEYFHLGRKDDCINLLANRMGTHPIPRELKSRYDDLIRRASS